MLKKSLVLLGLCSSLFVGQNVNAQTRYVDPMFQPEATSDIFYRSAVNQSGVVESLKMDIYQPKNDLETKRALVVVAHPGAFIMGSKEDEFSASASMSYASKGYVVASINYRLVPDTALFIKKLLNDTAGINKMMGVGVYQAMQDIKASVRFMKKNADLYKIDTAKVFICGYSAGAVMAVSYNSIQESEFVNRCDTAGLGPIECGDNLDISSSIKGFTSFAGAIPDTSWIQDGELCGLMIHGQADTVLHIETGHVFNNDTMPIMYGSAPINRVAQSYSDNVHLISYAGLGHELNAEKIALSLDSSAIFFANLMGVSPVKHMPRYLTKNTFNSKVYGNVQYNLLGRAYGINKAGVHNLVIQRALTEHKSQVSRKVIELK